eukprot:TRINITY_DN9475_c0_g3_i1.p1 TRINITY_DN9475_c0_g3~~TRINITY_DN9475_c0_g3_i1.p1  ORF type:complete len:220 (-),score=59.34 TRINITY_DN9475_c0_g3_i1:76-690(-)
MCIRDRNIYDCLDAFNANEVLDAENLWFCKNCKQDVRAKKRMEITRIPPILILHLKRFKTLLDSAERIGTFVSFPLKGLDLEKYVKNSDIKPSYNLCAVSNHFGSIASGHYTAFAWNKVRRGWYNFDDTNVTRMTESKVCTSAAYVLFYVRQDIEMQVDYSKIKQGLSGVYRAGDADDVNVEMEEEGCINSIGLGRSVRQRFFK